MKTHARTSNRLLAVLAIGALSGLLSAVALAAAAPKPTAAPVSKEAPATKLPAAPGATTTEMPPVPPVDTSPNYIVGPGDVIQIFVWRNPELSVSVPVRPDGKVSTPLVEDIVAVGKRPSELARDIETRLSEYIRNPQVNVIVTNAVSSYSQVTVIGQVGKPQTVPYREGMKILDLVLAVGGLGEFAGANRAKLVRKDASGKNIETRVKLGDLVNKGRLKENIEVKPGDVLIVPESYF